MKFIVVPDSFKGSISSETASKIISDKLSTYFSGSEILSFPIADGGEGSLNFFRAYLGGKTVSVKVTDAFFNKINANYIILEKENTAIIEMAQCAAFSDNKSGFAPMHTTTYGVGEMILDAVNKGCKTITVCLGGSCTNDFGAGAATALGVKFLNKENEAFIPVGATLSEIQKIDLSGIFPCLNSVEFIAMYDVENTVYGKSGAAYVFAKQKGATDIQIPILDSGLRHICKTVKRDLNICVDFLPGSGAAGAMGGALAAFFNAKLKSAADTVLDIIQFDNIILGADYIFSGEGRLDLQSLSGKAVGAIAKRAKQKNVPLIVLCGEYENHLEEYDNAGICAVFSINRKSQDFEVSRNYAEENLSLAVENIIKLIKIGKV